MLKLPLLSAILGKFEKSEILSPQLFEERYMKCFDPIRWKNLFIYFEASSDTSETKIHFLLWGMFNLVMHKSFKLDSE